MSMLSWRRLELLVGVIIALVAFIVYVATLCPTVNFIDSGELATVAYTLGIAHPTGYPLFSMVGWLFAHFPFGFRVIYQLNLMAAVLCAAGLFFFFRFLLFLITEFILTKEMKNVDRSSAVPERVIIHAFVPAAFGTFVLAFSETYWSQALSIEVYSLHVLFLASLLFLFLKAIAPEMNEAIRQERENIRPYYWYGFAFVLGLSFTNHMTTILLAPGFLFLYFYVHRFTEKAWRKILRVVLPFLIGFSIQIYLPVRASQHPLMNWGNPVDLERWFWHFSGKVYRVWIFSSTESAAKQFNYFFDTLPGQFVYAPVVLAIIGLIKLFRERRSLFVFTALLFAGCLFYSINYDIHDIDSYFLLAYFSIAIWCTVGSVEIVQMVKGRKLAIAAGGLFLLFSVILAVSNSEKVDESKNYLVEQYARDMLKSIEPNGIIISYQWDYFVSAAYYFQTVEHLRPDVVVIDKELMRRSWYYQQLENRYPWLISQSRIELNAFLVELTKFDHNIPYNPSTIENRYANLITSFVEKNFSSRPVYITPEIETQYTTGYSRVPSGLAFRLYKDTVLHQIPKVDFGFEIPLRTDIYVHGILSLYAQALVNNSIYSHMLSKNDDALNYVEQALRIEPTMREAIMFKDKLLSNH